MAGELDTKKLFINLLEELCKLEVLSFQEKKELLNKFVSLFDGQSELGISRSDFVLRKRRRRPTQATYRLTEIIEKYCLENKRHWRPKTESENRYILNLLVEVFGDKPIHLISKEKLREYKEVVLALPKNRNKHTRFKGLNIRQIINSEISEVDRMSDRNASKYFSRAKSFFKYAYRNSFISEDIGETLTFRLNENSSIRRVPFSQNDIRKMIKSPEYISGKLRGAKYWAPLIAMFSGMRLEEICGLRINDVRHLNNIWVFSVRENGYRKLKNKTSIRDVPIHDQLIELGFVDFLKSQKRLGYERVFSDLKSHRDGYSSSISKWFSAFCKRCQLAPLTNSYEVRSFHSFRHTVSTTLASSDLPERVLNKLLGHSYGDSETMKTYTHAISIKMLKSAVDKIQYRVSFKHLIMKNIVR